MVYFKAEIRGIKIASRTFVKGRNGTLRTSDLYKAYKQDLTLRLEVLKRKANLKTFTSNDLLAHVSYVLPNKRLIDNDNLQKGLFDALQAAGIIENDNQIRIVFSAIKDSNPDPKEYGIDLVLGVPKDLTLKCDFI